MKIRKYLFIRRKTLFILAAVLLILMSLAFVVGKLQWAEKFGSWGFGLVLLLLISYAPQFIKKGYVEKL